MEENRVSQDPQPIPVEKNSSIPKTFGILNIVFACCLMVCFGCIGTYSIMMAQLMPSMVKGVQDSIETIREEDIAQLEEELEAAETEEEKVGIQEQFDALGEEPEPVFPTFETYPILIGFGWTDLVSGVILNLLMLASGIGLLGIREWARKLALWVAGLKICRLLPLYGFFIVVIVPTIFVQMGEMMEQPQKQMQPGGGPGMPPDFAKTMVAAYGTMATVYGVALILLGSIYPAVVFWYLTRPEVIAACQGRGRESEWG